MTETPPPDVYVVTWRGRDGALSQAEFLTAQSAESFIAAMPASVRCEVRPPQGAPASAVRH